MTATKGPPYVRSRTLSTKPDIEEPLSVSQNVERVFVAEAAETVLRVRCLIFPHHLYHRLRSAYLLIEMELEAVLAIAAETSSILIALWTFSLLAHQMELTMSGIVSGNEQIADLVLVHDAKALDLVDIAGALRDHAVQSGTPKGNAKETEHVYVAPVP